MLAVECPDSRWLSEKQFAAFLSISVDVFRKKVKQGVIPAPKTWSRQSRRWHYRVAVYVYLGVELGLIELESGCDESEIAEKK